MYNIIYDGFKSWDDWVLSLDSYQIEDAKVIESYVHIPFSSNYVDLSEFNGSPSYKQRQFEAIFTMMKNDRPLKARYSEIVNEIHGRKIKITDPRDTDYYYEGRANVGEISYQNDTAHFTISATCNPYKLKHYKTVITYEPPAALTTYELPNESMPTNPIITTTHDTQIIQGAKSWSVNAGTHRLAMVFKRGMNEIKLRSLVDYNLIPVANRQFEGWTAQGGATVTVTKCPLEVFEDGYSRNLIKRTKDFFVDNSRINGWEVYFTSVIQKITYPNFSAMRFYRTGYVGLNIHHAFSSYVEGEPGDIFTLSFDLKVNDLSLFTASYNHVLILETYDENNERMTYRDTRYNNNFVKYDKTVENGVWVRANITFNVDDSKQFDGSAWNILSGDLATNLAKVKKVGFRFALFENGDFEVANAKLEKGSVATPYTQAWEDYTDGEKPAAYIETSGGEWGGKYQLVTPSFTTEQHKISVVVKNIGINTLEIRNLSVTSSMFVTTNQLRDISLVINTPTTASQISMGFATLNSQHSLKFYAYNPEVYATSKRNRVTIEYQEGAL